MRDDFYILLPVHNRKEITRSFVKCLEQQSCPDYHLVLIDDGSTDGTAKMVREIIHAVTVLQGEGDWWWAGSLQKGVDWLKEHGVNDNAIILFINDDVTFLPDYLERARSVMRDRSGLLLLSRFSSDGGDVVSETGVAVDLRRLTFDIASKAEEINCFSTRGLFMRFRDVKTLGNFHPRLLPHYLSDYQYTMRAAKYGLCYETSERVFLCPNHDESGYRDFEEESFFRFLKKYFSIKSVVNPVYSSIFIVFCAPALWVLPGLARVWYKSSKTIIRRLFIRWNIL